MISRSTGILKPKPEPGCKNPRKATCIGGYREAAIRQQQPAAASKLPKRQLLAETCTGTT